MVRSVLRSAVVVGVSFALAAATIARAATLESVEYYNAALDHYFVTALADEIAKLDAGTIAGWQRTGQRFAVFDPATPVAGASPVCRFYGRPEAGLDSHFYSASPAECAEVLQGFGGAWMEETDDAFGVWLPDQASGQCPAASIPVYRLWNQRHDSNHRFTTDLATLQTMIALGYKAEGYGPASAPVAMCAPTGEAPGSGGGVSDAAPKCTLSRTAQTDPPVAGGIVALKATCDATVGSYSWIGCASTTRVCVARESSPGPHTYTVIAHNADGSGPPASVAIGWSASAPPPPGMCGQFPSYLYSDVGPESVRVESVLYTRSPGFAWNGAWTVRFVVPPTTDPTRLGTISALEFAGEPTIREATISRTACDFRPTDPSGANGPVARATGSTAINRITVDPSRVGYPVLQPGGVYYYNLRNWRVSDGTISCPQSPGRCDALVEFSIPH